MSRMSRTPLAAAVALTASALALSACSQELAEPGLDTAATSAEGSQVETTPDDVTATVTEAVQPEVPEATGIAADTFKVDPLAYTMFITGTGSNGCVVPTHEDYENGPAFQCGVNLTTPQTAFTDLGYPAPDNTTTAIRYDPVIGFYTFSDDGQPFLGSARELNPGERVTLTGFTFTRVDEHTLTIERGLAKATIKDGELIQENPDPKRGDNPTTSATEGTRCGTISGDNGPIRAVIALENGTNCTAAMDVVNEYTSPATPIDNTALTWTAPNGWECARGHHPPGQPWNNANTRPVCKGEGSSIVIIEEELL